MPLLRRHFPQVKIIEGKENIGFGQGHNQIIRRVHSDFHAVINPDIFFKSNVILQMVRYMEEHPEVVQLTPMIRNLDGTIQYLPKRDPNFKFVVLSKLPFLKHYRRIYTMEDTVMIRPAKVMSCTGCFSVIRTSVLKKVHGYDRRFLCILRTRTYPGGSGLTGILSIIRECTSTTPGKEIIQKA